MTKNHNTIWLWIPKFIHVIIEQNSVFYSKVEVAQRISSAFLHHVHFYSSQVTTKEWKMIICFPSYFMAITTWREGASTYSSYPPRNTFSTLYDEVHSLRLWSFKQVLYYCKVGSSNRFRLEAHAGFFRLLMKEIFYPYVLWPFDKKLIF